MHTLHRLIGLLIALFVVAAPLTVRAVDPEPLSLPVSYSFKIWSGGNGILKIIDGVAPYVVHFDSWGPESDVGTSQMKPGKTYTMNFQASGIGGYSISLTPPSGYQFYVNGIPKDFVSGGGGNPQIDYDVEIRPVIGAGYLEVAAFTGIDIGQAVTWELGMGAARAGHSVGRLGFRELDLSNSPATREHLLYVPPINTVQANVIYDGTANSRIRQIAGPRKLVDLVDETVSGVPGYWINYYNYDDTTWTGSGSTGYTINSGKTPWRIVRVESPAANQLRIIEKENISGATERVSHLSLTSGTVSTGTYDWLLQEGGPAGAWLRTTTHHSVKSGGTRENVVTVRTGGTGGTIVAETKYVYHTYAWGEDLYQVIVNPNGGTNALTTTYDYYETAPAFGSEANRGNYRRVKSVTGPGGGWTAYEYYDTWAERGQIKTQYQPYLDAPATVTLNPAQGSVTAYTYADDTTGRNRRPLQVLQTINGTQTSRTNWTYDNSSSAGLQRIKADVDSYSASGASIRTHTESIDPLTADIDQSGEPYVVKNPDRTQISWSRASGDYNSSTKVFSVPGVNSYYWRILKVNGTTSATDLQTGAAYTSVSSYDSQSFAPIYLVPQKSTMEITILDYAGVPLRTETRIYTSSGTWSDAIGAVDSTYDFTRTNRLLTSTASNGTTTTYSYDVNGRVGTTTGGDGTIAQMTYDALGRTLTTKKVGASSLSSSSLPTYTFLAQADTMVTYDYDGLSHATTETLSGVGTSETIVTRREYDLAGRPTKLTPPGLGATVVSYDATNRIQTTTNPDGSTSVQEAYRDGRVKSVTGTAVVAQYYTYAVETDGRQWAQINSGTSTSARYRKAWTDWLGRSIKSESPAFSTGSPLLISQEQTYDATTGQLVKATRTGYAALLYGYNALGQMVREGLDVNGNGTLDLAGTDRITDHLGAFYNDGTTWWWQQSDQIYGTNGSATPYSTGQTLTRLTGLSLTQAQWTDSYDALGNLTRQVLAIDPSTKKATLTVTVPGSSVNGKQVSHNGRLVETVDTTGLVRRVEYDVLGRPEKAIDPRTGTAQTAYNTGTSQVFWTKDTVGNAQATYGYDAMGRVINLRDVYGRYAYSSYNSRGQLEKQWGETVQPVSYAYDSLGQRTSLSTYRGGSGWTASTWPGSPGTADTTTWSYDAGTGFVTQKTDASSASVNFTYTQAGQVLTRQWARGVTATYAYSGITGELSGVSYSDTTPGTTYAYSRLGQVTSITDMSDSSMQNFEYDANWQLKTEKLPSYLGSRWLTYNYEGSGSAVPGRATGYTVGISSALSQDQATTYGYDTYGRTGSVGATHAGLGLRTFTYGYLANSNLLAGISESTTGYNVVRSYESARDLLTALTTQFGSTVKTGYNYTYDVQGLRATALQSGGSTTAFADYGSDTYYRYAYNARGELTGAIGYMGSTVTSTAAPMPGRAYGYTYDNAGNRTSADSSGVPGLQNDYTLNNLNQITARENNYVEVSGTLDAGAKILVNGGLAGQQGKYWSGEAVLSNSSNPVYASIPLKAVKTGTTNLKKITGVSAFIAKALEAYVYDADGNLTKDGRWDYTYDGENRLITMQANSATLALSPALECKRLEFRYDSQGRRTGKRVYTWSGSSWVPDTTTATKGERLFVYQGWNLVAELDNSGNLMRSFAWGLDIAGSFGATGGIGALIQMVDHTSGSPVAYLPGYDAQGNVTALMKSDGTIAAAYEYSPFGEVIRKEGAYAAINPFRNATKYTDEETGLVYYGHRYYNPSTGRFINRDPSEEAGGVNLYGFCGNNGINSWDYLGLDPAADYAQAEAYWNHLQSLSEEDRNIEIGINAMWQQIRPDNVGTSGPMMATEADMNAAMQSAFERSYATHLENSIHAAMQDAANNKDMAEFTRLDNLAVTLIGSSLRANGGGGTDHSSVTAGAFISPETGDTVGTSATTWYADGTSSTTSWAGATVLGYIAPSGSVRQRYESEPHFFGGSSGAPNTGANNTSPWQLGVQWLTGTGPRQQNFKDGDPMTVLLQQHSHIEDTRKLIASNIANGGNLKGPHNYGLGGLAGVPKYLKDYSTLATGGLTGNLAVTYLGSYHLDYNVTGINFQNGTATVQFHVTNDSTINSAIHPPVIGYTQTWNTYIGQPLNNFFSSGPLSKTSQDFQWTETIKWP